MEIDKEKTANWTVTGITMMLLLTMGINAAPEDTHYSPTLEITMHCERLSGTGNTCYPHSDDRKGSKYSADGWVPILEDTVDTNPPRDNPSTDLTQERCPASGCIDI